MSPRPALPEGKSTRLALAGLAGLAALKAVALVLLMGALAHALAQWAAGTQPNVTRLIVQGSVGAGLMGLTVWGQSVLARRAALGTKEELRAKLVAHRLNPRMGAATSRGEARNGVGAESMLASRGLDGLDNYFSSYLPALVTCAVLPFLVGVQILVADWVSALIVVLTVPLVPVFMVLIGFHTQERVEEAASGLDRLSNHLLELARGLPVLVGLRRAAAQRKALADVCESYRKSTMATLRTAFLSSMALELISTISVAVVAVFIGVRLVNGDMGLEAGLLALMLAPECFRPLRDVGAAHHGSEDGVEALRRVKEILGDETAPRVQEGEALAAITADHAGPGGTGLRIENLSVSYPGRGDAVVDGYSAELAPGQALVLATPSGSGKSTILAAIAGTLDHGATDRETARVTGSLQRRTPGAQVFVPQHPVFTEETVHRRARPLRRRAPRSPGRDGAAHGRPGRCQRRTPGTAHRG
ncbi:ABC transporter transmembrane domain-containing protein [Arthrobacter psychrolactophilus]